MKSLLERITWVKIVEGSLLVVLGILVGVLGGLNTTKMINALSICIAIFLFIDGLINTITFLLNPKQNFSVQALLGCAFITFGVLLCLHVWDGGMAELIAFFVAIMLLTAGGIYLIKSLIQISIKEPWGWVIINLLIAALGISLGTVAVVYASKGDAQFMQSVFIILGIAIAVLGVVELIFAINKYYLNKKPTSTKDEEKEAKTTNKKKVIKGEIKKEKEPKKLTHKKVKELPLETKEKEVEEEQDDTDDDVVEETPETTVVDPE